MIVDQGYVISFRDGAPYTIEHLVCGRVSWNKNDVEQHYCGHCHQFIDLFCFEGWQGLMGVVREALRWPKDSEGL